MRLFANSASDAHEVPGFNARLLLATKALGGVMDTRSGRRFAFTIVATNGVFADIEGVFAANEDVGKIAAIIQQAY